MPLHRAFLLLSLLAAAASPAPAAQQPEGPGRDPAPSFEDAARDVQARLAASLAELTELRRRIAEEKIPLGRELSALEAELVAARREHQEVSRLLDGRTLDLSNLRGAIQAREDEASYVSSLLAEYARSYGSRLHVAELARHEAPLREARLALENTTLGTFEVLGAQLALLASSLARLEDVVGGARFEGTAVSPSGLVLEGEYALLGPVAVFRAADGSAVGLAQQRLGSLEPALAVFPDPLDAAAADELVVSGKGSLPLDPTLGDALKIAGTRETWLEHVRKGGPVMIPIFALAALALLIALFKWLSLAFVRRPSRRKVDALLEAVAAGDVEAARGRARAIGGPTGRMLRAGLEHLSEPRELLEEVLHEQILVTRLRLQRFLPFIAISAASAPLLGLLGTVTGIMNTFKLITVFGSGDVRTLSGGISEALVTTQYGLIVAIPALLLSAYLSRKARRVVDQMEVTAVAFLNEAGRTPRAEENGAPPAPLAPALDGHDLAAERERVRAHVQAVLGDMLQPPLREVRQGGPDRAHREAAPVS